ncbi:AzlD domain-containing protein [Shimia sp. R11_0]|uniref:Putative membrane protein n=1 Tax=Shimia marina TaxID=321267 RepID=A0A0P1EUC5_9RHOB|nr:MULTISPECIES: AzlD domain-containing protein [Shimia]MBO9478396.1 AzlD domain-containing protein [Shimia sp. R11_0]CUH54245.1 putative membrane protein [Shimia marina]SFD98462.1 Branched-chain amino acid transport protein [Shimia marina]
MSETATIWLIIVSLGIGSFGLRYIFLGVIGDRQMPEWILRHLRYTAVAVLPGLVAPLVIWPAATGGQPDPARMSAAAVTLVVGYLTKNVLAAIFAGAGTLFLMLYLLA